MNKFQPTSFKTIEPFLDFITPEEREIVLVLRELVFECIPNCREKMSYNVPFYYLKKRLCYIWPASVGWSGINEGVDFGFCQGYLLNDDIGWLESRGRKEIRSKIYLKTDEIEKQLLKSYLHEAENLDSEL